MFNKSKNDNMTYGIVGLGRFGMALAIDLAESGSEIIALDSNEEKVQAIREYTENAFIVKNLEKKTLIETGIQNCDVAIVCIGEHMDTSILTTLNLVSMGIPKVISKACSLAPSSSTRSIRISSAKCSISVKSRIFFSLFFSP